MFDPDLYREKTEIEKWKRHDPIALWTDHLRASGLVTDADLAQIENDVARELELAVEYADAGTFEPISDLTRDVMSPEPETHS